MANVCSEKPDVFRYIAEPNGVESRCIFCKIGDGRVKPGGKSSPTELVFENERIVAFHDIVPGAKLHILIIPKQHLKNCWALSQELLDEMDAVADEILKDHGASDTPTKRFFIRPPLNSVYHVHMYVMILPIIDPIWSLRRIGFESPWFHITPDDLRRHNDKL